jgi:hypothetical protein
MATRDTKYASEQRSAKKTAVRQRRDSPEVGKDRRRLTKKRARFDGREYFVAI